MPIVSDPKARYEYVLESDSEEPIESRAVFFFRVMTTRKYRASLKTITALRHGQSNDKVFDAAMSLITDNLVDWHNIRMPGGESLLPFDPKDEGAIQDIVGIDEMMELAFAVVNQLGSAEDKKKLSSESTSPSDSADVKPAEG